MMPMPQAAFSHAYPSCRAGKYLQFPLIRILIAVAFLVPVLVLNKAVKAALLSRLSENALVWVRYIEAGVFFLLFMSVFKLYTRLIEKRKALEITGGEWFYGTASGFLAALILVGVVATTLFSTDNLTVSGMIANKRLVLDLFVKFFMGAFLEELLFRIIIFKLTEELFGTWIALALQIFLFGFAHRANENASLFTSLAVAQVGGLLYSAAFIFSRSLWLPLGLHWGWNFFQSGIFSMANSGTPYAGLLVTKVSGPEWLTGGQFGIKASYLAILLCLTAAIVLITFAWKNQQVVSSIWKRKKVQPRSSSRGDQT